MIPWHSLSFQNVNLMFEMIKNSIEALEFHLGRPTNQIDKDLLPRMMSVAQCYPAFSQTQRSQFLKDIPLKLNQKLIISD